MCKLPIFVPCAESPQVLCLLLTFLQELLQELLGLLDPPLLPIVVWEQAQDLGSRNALRQLPVLLLCFPPKPGEAPAILVPSGTMAGADGATGASAYPSYLGVLGSPPLARREDARASAPCQTQPPKAGLCVTLETLQGGSELTQTHSESWQQEPGGAGEPMSCVLVF